jgi:thiol-disulfide isomerase/thioredoxin/outer membrane lipoprotein-sorting protein
MRHALPSIVAVFLAATTSAYTQAPAPHSEAFDLLTRVVQRYTDAKSYDIESTEERTSTGELMRDWSKSVLIAAEAPGNRYHFEGHTAQGSGIQISDGKTAWNYRIEEHRYTATPYPAAVDSHAGPIGMGDLGTNEARNLPVRLQSIVKTLASAEFLPDEKLPVDGRAVRCRVVHVRSSDEKRVNPNFKYDRKIWIDADRNVILKIAEKSDSFLIVASGRIPLALESTTVYSKTILDEPVPDDLFTFQPPNGTRQIAEFPDPSETFGLSSMAGDPMPPLKFKAADGSLKTIESFRGKPVLIDFWATWCAPCVAAMPKLAELYKDAKSKGLVLISVDQDEDAAKAAEFLKKQGYDWENFHDGDGAIAKLLPSPGIPHMVLVDASGTVAYDTTGGDDNRLRMHLAKLGSDFADLAPKPKASPCNVALQSLPQ